MKVKSRGAVVGFCIGLLVGGLLAAGAATASIPSSSGGVVSACVNRVTGVTRIIDTEARRRCTSAERLVTWARNTPRGAWSRHTAYAAGDIVQYRGSSWQAKLANSDRTPAAGRYWTLLAAAGATGPQGAQGPQGLPGPQGLQGPRGERSPSDVYRASPSASYITITNAGADILTKTLPAGTFLITAVIWVSAEPSVPSSPPVEVGCVLTRPEYGWSMSTDYATIPESGVNGYRNATLSLAETLTFGAPTTIKVTCSRSGGPGGVITSTWTARLFATPVTNVL